MASAIFIEQEGFTVKFAAGRFRMDLVSEGERHPFIFTPETFLQFCLDWQNAVAVFLAETASGIRSTNVLPFPSERVRRPQAQEGR